MGQSGPTAFRPYQQKVIEEFATTHWSLVLSAAQNDGPTGKLALERLCQSYWYPLYAFVRRQGKSPHESEDLIQEFFAGLLARQGLAKVRPEHGRFRSFLLAALKNFLANQWDRSQALKRGGGRIILSWGESSAEERYRIEPYHEASPEKLYEQSWALAVVDSVLIRLRQEYQRAGKEELFTILHSYLEEEATETYSEIGAKLRMSEAAVKMSVVRLRESFRRCLRTEIARLVGDSQEIDDELRHLFACLGR